MLEEEVSYAHCHSAGTATLLVHLHRSQHSIFHIISSASAKLHPRERSIYLSFFFGRSWFV